MGKLRFAVASAAVSAAAVVAGPAFAGVHVMTITQSPLVTVDEPTVGIPGAGFDIFELNLSGLGEAAASGGGVGAPTPVVTNPNQNGPDGQWTNRSESRDSEHGHHGGGGGGPLSVPSASSSDVSGPAAGLNTWHGLDHWDQRFGNGSNNQFSLEPPDQGMCVGDGQVLEVVNNVIRSFTPTGAPTSDPRSLSTFFGYPPAVVRTTGTIGPQVTDPSCTFDPRTHKFIVIALTYEVIPTGPGAGNPTGKNHIDIATTSSAVPTVAVSHYMIPVQNDGTGGTPSGPAHKDCPCVGDFPQLGMDNTGFYVTTNEYPWFANGFNGAQLYAMSRTQLTLGSPVLRVVHFDGLTVAGNPAFTMWPARSNEGDYNNANRGTENFLSSMAAQEANNTAGIDNRIAVWSLSNTRSLDASTPNLRIDNQVVQTETYAIPPPSDQKVSDALPLRDCLNDKPFVGLPAPCSILLNGKPDKYKPEVQGPLDSSDTRLLTNWYINGTLIGALDTALKVGGQTKAGIAWFAFDARRARLGSQGYLAVAGNNVIYPAIATLPNGKGAMAFTLSGRNFFPSAAYASVRSNGGDDNNVNGDNNNGNKNNNGNNDNGGNGNHGDGGRGAASVGSVKLAFQGVGPQDGFSEYRYYSPTGDGVPRPRWGDFGAAASDGTSIWIGSEYIGQTCTYEVWLTTNFQCFATGKRTALANWGTRITQVP